MVDLPYDVWATIASYIEEGRLLKLASVHPAFLSIALDTRYREIWWVKLDEHMVATLRRLQDPVIAQRVRRLHIRAWFIEFLLKQKPPKPVGPEAQSWASAIWGWAAGTEPQVSFPTREPSDISLEKRLGTMSSPGDITRAMIAAMAAMANVLVYDFEWRDLPLKKHTQIFLITARTAFDTSLTKLVLSARVSKLADILLIMDFKQLEELEFTFEYDPTSFNTDGSAVEESVVFAANRDLLTKRVSPFINHLSPSLRSLTITSSALADHSQFFEALSFLPALRRFAIRISFDTKHLTDPSGLFRILHAQISTLQSLEIEPTGSGTKLLRQHLLNIVRHPFLERLRIPSLDQEMTMSLVKRTADNLTGLSLSGRFLSVNEVVEIVDLFATASRVSLLDQLDLKVHEIPPRLLDILANGLPGLRALTLVINQEYSDLQRPTRRLDYQRYPNWRLSSISIYLKIRRPDTVFVIPYTKNEFDTMVELWTLIPSIKWLKGQDVETLIPSYHGAFQRYTASIEQRPLTNVT